MILNTGNRWVISKSASFGAFSRRFHDGLHSVTSGLNQCRKVSSPAGASFINNPGLHHNSTRSTFLIRILVRIRVLVRSTVLCSAAWCTCCDLDQGVWTLILQLRSLSGQAAGGRSFLLQQEGVAGAALWTCSTALPGGEGTDSPAGAGPVVLRQCSRCRLVGGRHRPLVVSAGFTAFRQSKHSRCWSC